MATVLGLGVFIYLLKIIIESDNKKMFYLNVLIFCLLFYRGLLTFSRGGIATGIIVVITLFLSMYISRREFYKSKTKFGFLLLILLSVFILTAYQTDNFLLKRYTNFETEQATNIQKVRGRYMQIESDIKNFSENPLLGVGVGKGREIRKQDYNKVLKNLYRNNTNVIGTWNFRSVVYIDNNFYPLQLYFNDTRNFYLLPFFLFWIFTINHLATRTIAPLFLYALALLQIKEDKEATFLY